MEKERPRLAHTPIPPPHPPLLLVAKSSFLEPVLHCVSALSVVLLVVVVVVVVVWQQRRRRSSSRRGKSVWLVQCKHDVIHGWHKTLCVPRLGALSLQLKLLQALAAWCIGQDDGHYCRNGWWVSSVVPSPIAPHHTTLSSAFVTVTLCSHDVGDARAQLLHTVLLALQPANHSTLSK